MPIYEYACPKCNRVYEHMHPMAEKPTFECEACGTVLEKKISAAAFSFKGGGWYKDLYASPKPDSGKTDKSESKPAASETPKETSKKKDASKD